MPTYSSGGGMEGVIAAVTLPQGAKHFFSGLTPVDRQGALCASVLNQRSANNMMENYLKITSYIGRDAGPRSVLVQLQVFP